MPPSDQPTCPEANPAVSRRVFLKAVAAGASGFAIVSCTSPSGGRDETVGALGVAWAGSEDGRNYTLTIVENVTFHDGSPLRIDDIIWTFDRLRDPSLENSPTANLFADIESIEPGEGK